MVIIIELAEKGCPSTYFAHSFWSYSKDKINVISQIKRWQREAHVFNQAFYTA
jgi:hypothetical protein